MKSSGGRKKQNITLSVGKDKEADISDLQILFEPSDDEDANKGGKKKSEKKSDKKPKSEKVGNTNKKADEVEDLDAIAAAIENPTPNSGKNKSNKKNKNKNKNQNNKQQSPAKEQARTPLSPAKADGGDNILALPRGAENMNTDGGSAG